MITESEIVGGLVLHLDPNVLEAEGGTYSCPKSFRVAGDHWFVCLRVLGANGEWLPLYTNDGKGRIKVAVAGRKGHPKWTSTPSYYHPAQIWTATHTAVVKAADAAGDLSGPGQRNTIIEGYLPRLQA